MAVKGKVAKTKRNNQKRNKLTKQGVIRKSSKKVQKNVKELNGKIPKKRDEPEEEADIGEDLLEMVDEDDIDFLKEAISNRSYQIYNKVKYSGPIKPKRRRIDDEEDETLEKEYEEETKVNEKKTKNLLPIKTKHGIVAQEIEETKDEKDLEETIEEDFEENIDMEESDEEQFTFQGNNLDVTTPITTAKLLATRNDILRQCKIHIGTLSSGLLENPEEKVTNFRTLLKMLDDETPEVYFTIRKLAIASLTEIFKDILPSYEIKNVIDEGVKLKKDTLKLHKYEESLLQYYRKFLQKLEKQGLSLVKKNGDSRERSPEEIKLASLAIQSMCELLMSHPYFNFAQNLAQAIVPFLNNSNKNVRETVKVSIMSIIKDDKKEEITLKILRIVNQYMKTHAHNINVEMVEILLALNLKNVNLDFEKEQDIKQKKLNANKQKLLQMSKKERKRKKKLAMLENEMLETKAEESKQLKQKNLTEITKIVFNIIFRILKSSANTKVLGVCLEALAKFAHCINLEFYVDIVNVLDNLLKETWLGYKEHLHCIQTVFAILSGQGEVLNLDPTRFYNSFYKDLLTTNAGKNYDNALIVLKTVNDALIKRRRKITNKRTIGFVKRLATLSLQLLHNGTLGCLGIIKNIMQVNRSVDVLLDLDQSVGDGKFQADLDDPEYANASSTALYELIILNKHYHPIVNKYAKNIAFGVPATGDGSLAIEFGKRTFEELYNDFNMSEMAFNPAVPAPQKIQPKKKTKRLQFADNNFENECRRTIRRKTINTFWIEL